MSLKRVPTHGMVQFPCPKCDEPIEVPLTVTDAYGPICGLMASRHRPHPVEFVAVAPQLHARFWGHMVRCHQPDPHPYMSGLPVGEPQEGEQ
jgi:hypothetical protein